MVTVSVGDQDAADSGERESKFAERIPEGIAGLVKRPSRVDQHQPAPVDESVDVHCAQPVAGKGQGYPVHPGPHEVDARLGPGVTVGVGVA
jgi:hypothetical protein